VLTILLVVTELPKRRAVFHSNLLLLTAAFMSSITPLTLYIIFIYQSIYPFLSRPTDSTITSIRKPMINEHDDDMQHKDKQSSTFNLKQIKNNLKYYI